MIRVGKQFEMHENRLQWIQQILNFTDFIKQAAVIPVPDDIDSSVNQKRNQKYRRNSCKKIEENQ